jgi:hypothetical protein
MRCSATTRWSVAEIEYRNHRHDSIPEGNIVRVINDLASTLKLPAYAKTSARQVRVVRSALHVLAPHLVESVSSHVASDRMSPAEAAYVALFLALQKLNNPYFQLEPSEWDQKDLTRPRPGPPGTSSPAEPRLTVSSPTPLERELRAALQAAVSSMSAATLEGVINKALDDAGF